MEKVLNEKSHHAGKYETFFRGTIGDLENCQTILLYKYTNSSNRPSLEKLSVDSFNETVKELGLLLTKEDNQFIYSKKSLPSGFNTIIYLNYLEKPIGYTEFVNTQGIVPELIVITLKFSVSAEIGQPLVIKVDSGLSNITKVTINSKIEKLLQSDKLYGLTNIRKANTELEKAINIYPRYTKFASNLLKNNNEFIYLDYGVCNFTGLYKLNLVKEMTIAEDLKNHQLGYYRGEIVLYSWSNISGVYKFSINSLSRENKFGNPICYTNTTTGTKDIVQNPRGNIKTIRYFSGKYLSATITTSGNEDIYAVYNVETNDWVDLDSENHVMDLWGIDSQIIELPKVKKLSKDSIIDFCPGIVNTFLDIRNYTYSVDLVKKVGEWYILNQVRVDSNNNFYNFEIYTNITKTVIISKSDPFFDSDPIIINNNILALRTTDLSRKLDYYTYYLGDGDVFYSENALATLSYIECGKSNLIYPQQTSSLESQKVSNKHNIILCSEYKRNDKTTNNVDNYGVNLFIDHIGKENSIINSIISGFRRNTCPDNLAVPELIGSINGLIYYKTKDNKIKLL